MEPASAAASSGGGSLKSLLPSGPDAPTPGTQAGAVGGQGPVVPGTPQPCSHSGPAERLGRACLLENLSGWGGLCPPGSRTHTHAHPASGRGGRSKRWCGPSPEGLQCPRLGM